MKYLHNYKKEIKKICSSHQVKTLFAFGSVNNANFSVESDVDLLVTFNQFDLALYFTNYIDLKEKLENLFERKVDLVEAEALINPILIRSIDRTKEFIYGRKN